jgi:hypothetical protein
VIDDGFGGTGEAAVEVTIIRRKDNPVFPDDVDDVSKLLLIGFAGKIKLPAF